MTWEERVSMGMPVMAVRPPARRMLKPEDLPARLRHMAAEERVDCRIEGVRRLSGLGCLHYQTCLARPRRTPRGFLHERYRACLECPFWLSDADYRALRQVRSGREKARNAMKEAS